MKRDDRKKLTANELYLNECMTILYTKIRATGFNFFGKDGSLLSNNILNIENYCHGTITCVVNPNSVRVRYDGTDFTPSFAVDDNGGFRYTLKPLGLEYTCFDRKLDEVVHEKKVIRKVGDSVDYYRYLSCGTFFILLEHSSKDENGFTMVVNTLGRNYDDRQLIDYIQEQMQIAEEMTREDDDDSDELSSDEKFAVEEELESMDDSPESQMLSSQDLSPEDLVEIEAYISDDDEYPDLFEIDYSLADILKDKVTDDPYSSDYPDRIEDFDYQEYIRGIKSGVSEEVVYSTDDSDKHDSKDNEADNDDDLDYVDYDEEDDDYDEESSGDLYSETDTISTEEGFIDDSYFSVIQNGEEVADQRKCDIVDDAVEGIMDVNQEIMTLQDYYCDLIAELKKMRAIIIKRRELKVKRKSGQTGSDVSDSGNKSDKDIDDE